MWPNPTTDDPPTTDDRYLYDTIYLEGEQTRPKKRFRIVAVDPEVRTVTVDEAPDLTQASPWRIHRRPWIVAIDPVGGRLWGHDASVDPAVPGRINLPSADLSRLNLHFDTIYLPSDIATPRRTYRIHEINATAKWVNVRQVPTDPVPSFSGPGLWHIQAGVSGNILALNYDFDATGNGWDHYDAAMFIVHGGEIQFIAPWSTYTSHNYADYHPWRSTIRGNKDYEYSSYRSGDNPFINYALKVVDFGAGKRPGIAGLYDGVREARWYFEEETRDDTQAPGHAPSAGLGKTLIRFHHGAVSATASESAGCVVSPKYTDLRSNLVQLHLAERTAFYPDGNSHAADHQLARLIGATHRQAEATWGNTDNPLPQGDWMDKLVGWVWIIRPDERPL